MIYTYIHDQKKKIQKTIKILNLSRSSKMTMYGIITLMNSVYRANHGEDVDVPQVLLSALVAELWPVLGNDVRNWLKMDGYCIILH